MRWRGENWGNEGSGVEGDKCENGEERDGGDCSDTARTRGCGDGGFGEGVMMWRVRRDAREKADSRGTEEAVDSKNRKRYERLASSLSHNDGQLVSERNQTLKHA